MGGGVTPHRFCKVCGGHWVVADAYARIIGFEGGFPADVIATWGAAMLSDGEHLWNGLSGRCGPAAEACDYFRKGAATRLIYPIAVDDAVGDTAIVAAFRRDRIKAAHAVPKGVRAIAYEDAGFFGHIFQRRADFNSYAKQMGETFAKLAKRPKLQPNQHRGFIYAGLAFTPRCPELHAMRVARLKGGARERGASMTEATLRSDEDRATFRRRLKVLTRVASHASDLHETTPKSEES